MRSKKFCGAILRKLWELYFKENQVTSIKDLVYGFWELVRETEFWRKKRLGLGETPLVELEGVLLENIR